MSTSCSLNEVLGEFENDVTKGVIQHKTLSSLGTFASSLSSFGDGHYGLKGNIVDYSFL